MAIGPNPFEGLSINPETNRPYSRQVFAERPDGTRVPAYGYEDTPTIAEEKPGVIKRVATGFGRGVARGTLQSGASAANLFGYKDASQTMEDLAGEYQRDMESFRDIGGVSDFLTWQAELIGENVFTIGSIALGGVATGGIAASVPAIRAVLGASAFAKGATAGAAAVDFTQQLGETTRTVEEAGVEPTAANTVPAALLKTTLDMLPIIAIARRLGMPGKTIDAIVTRAAEEAGVIRRVTNQAGVIAGFMAAEGGTEGAQQWIDQVNRNIITEGLRFAPNKQEWLEITEAAAGGAAVAMPFAFLARKPRPNDFDNDTVVEPEDDDGVEHPLDEPRRLGATPTDEELNELYRRMRTAKTDEERDKWSREFYRKSADRRYADTLREEAIKRQQEADERERQANEGPDILRDKVREQRDADFKKKAKESSQGLPPSWDEDAIRKMKDEIQNERDPALRKQKLDLLKELLRKRAAEREATDKYRFYGYETKEQYGPDAGPGGPKNTRDQSTGPGPNPHKMTDEEYKKWVDEQNKKKNPPPPPPPGGPTGGPNPQPPPPPHSYDFRINPATPRQAYPAKGIDLDTATAGLKDALISGRPWDIINSVISRLFTDTMASKGRTHAAAELDQVFPGWSKNLNDFILDVNDDRGKRYLYDDSIVFVPENMADDTQHVPVALSRMAAQNIANKYKIKMIPHKIKKHHSVFGGFVASKGTVDGAIGLIDRRRLEVVDHKFTNRKPQVNLKPNKPFSATRQKLLDKFMSINNLFHSREEMIFRFSSSYTNSFPGARDKDGQIVEDTANLLNQQTDGIGEIKFFQDPKTLYTPDEFMAYDAIKEIYKELHARYTPHAKVYVVLTEHNKMSPYTGGYATSIRDHHMVVLNPTLASSFANRGQHMHFARVEVALHEYGHVIQRTMYAQAPKEVRQALYYGYQQYLDFLRDDTLSNKNMKEKHDAYYAHTSFQIDPSAPTIQDTGYVLNYDEWFAEQFRFYITRNTVLSAQNDPLSKTMKKHMEHYFQKLMTKLSDMFSFIRTHPKLKKLVEGSRASFEQFLEYTEGMAQGYAPFATVEPVSVNTGPNLNPGKKDGVYSRFGAPQEPSVEADAIRSDIWRLFGDLTPPDDFMPQDLEGKKAPGLPIDEGLQRFGGFWQKSLTLLQIGYRYPHLKGVQDYIKYVQEQWAEKIRITAIADQSLKLWRQSKDQGNRVSKLVFDVTMTSDKLGRRLTPDELAALFAKHGLNEKGIALFNKLDADFRGIINDLEQATIDSAKYHFPDPILREVWLSTRADEFKKLKDRHYFPLSRFGQYTIALRAARDGVEFDGRRYNKDEIMMFETHETPARQKARAQELSKEFAKYTGQYTIFQSYLKDSEFSFLGFPPALMETMTKGLGLSETQQSHLKAMMANLSPTESYRRHLMRREGLKGFSTDAQRVYASYMMHAAGHISRMKYYQKSMDSIANVKPEAGGANSIVHQQLQETLNRHYHYLINPGEEWASLRSALFTYYLGFSPKSALINLTQMPMVAYPYLAARFGDAQSVGHMTKAMKDVMLNFKSGKGLTPDELKALAQGRNDGFLDESLASDLAAIAEGNNLARALPISTLEQKLRDVGAAGAWMFQKTELINRRITFLAAYRLSGGNYEAARDAVQQTMFEYARWNRPEFMRGRKSVLFVFMQYTQHILHFMMKDKGRARAMLMLFAMAGLQGLPGAEDLFDLFDISKNMFSRLTGWGDPYTDSRTEVRMMMDELGANPDLIMHGMGRQSLGLSFLGMPGFDLSGSLSAGRVVPGVGPTADAIVKGGVDPTKFAAQVGQDVGGAGVAVGVKMLQALTSRDPDLTKRLELIMPSAMRDMSRGIRYLQEGKETNSLGDTLVTFDIDETEGMAQAIGQALGFRPAAITQLQEKEWAQREAAEYYQTRRELLLAQFYFARSAGDREAIADMRSAISRYNSEVPFPIMRINGKALHDSYLSRQRSAAKRERGDQMNRRMQPLADQIGEVYEGVRG